MAVFRLRLTLLLLRRLLVAELGKASAAAVPRRNPVYLLAFSSAGSACCCWCWCRPHHASLVVSALVVVAVVLLVPAAAAAVLVWHVLLLLQQSLPSMRPLVIAVCAFPWHPSPRRDSCPFSLAPSLAVNGAHSGWEVEALELSQLLQLHSSKEQSTNKERGTRTGDRGFPMS